MREMDIFVRVSRSGQPGESLKNEKGSHKRGALEKMVLEGGLTALRSVYASLRNPPPDFFWLESSALGRSPIRWALRSNPARRARKGSRPPSSISCFRRQVGRSVR